MFIQLTNLPDQELVEGYMAKMIHTDNLSVIHVKAKAGYDLPKHRHPHEQITNVLVGRFEMTVDGITQICESGDVVVIPSNVYHSGRALTDCSIIDVFNPPREDYKNK